MCSERSGSNLITKVLNGHKNICGPSTKHILNPVARNPFRYGDLSQSENWQQLVEDIHNLLTIDFSIWRRSFLCMSFNPARHQAISAGCCVTSSQKRRGPMASSTYSSKKTVFTSSFLFYFITSLIAGTYIKLVTLATWHSPIEKALFIRAA